MTSTNDSDQMNIQEDDSKKEIGGCLSLIILASLGLLIFTVLFSGGAFLYIKYENYVAKKAPQTAEEIRAEKIDKSFSSWDGSHYELTRLIKKSMHDPSSYKHVKTRHECDTYTCNSLLVRTSYRGKNLFGGTVLNRVTARVDLEGNLIEVISQQ